MNKQLRMQLVPWVIASFFAASAAFAQNTSSSLSGRIVDAGGKPVAGATVEIIHVPSGTSRTVLTDATGRYSVQGLRVGGPAIHPAILTPLLVMALAFVLLFVAMHLAAMRNEILRRRVPARGLLQATAAQGAGTGDPGPQARLLTAASRPAPGCAPPVGRLWGSVAPRPDGRMDRPDPPTHHR